ncbi:MAG: ABC transporter permease [Ferruginibacter sp.]|nr:ABC transporter permease [Ferruginibacter sp.]
MIFTFAWRYFRAKKSAHAIQIISWVTASVIAFATCCQILVLSVFNGFEDLVRSLYATFYTDIKIVPARGKTITLTPEMIEKIRSTPGVAAASLVLEEKALLQHGESQTVIFLKGVDENYTRVSNVADKITRGNYETGTADEPMLVMGSGIRQATGIVIGALYEYMPTTVILPKAGNTSNDPLSSMSEGNVVASGSFTIQQEFDNTIALTNLPFVRQQLALPNHVYTSMDIQLNPDAHPEKLKKTLQHFAGPEMKVLNRYEQNTSLFNTMKTEKWAIYAVLTLILIIAAFNMISALTMLVLEKKRDISILKSLGSSNRKIQQIFMSEGLLLGFIGAAAGITLATIICFLQIEFKLIPMQGDSFLISHFPVKLLATDFLMVAATALSISLLASWLPAYRASRQPVHLR